MENKEKTKSVNGSEVEDLDKELNNA